MSHRGLTNTASQEVPASLKLAVLATDPITRDGVTTYFRSCERVRLLPAHFLAEVDVIVIFTGEVTAHTISTMRGLAADSTNPAMRIVVVGDSLSESLLLRAVRYRLASFLMRSRTTMDSVLEAVLSVQQGMSHMPDVLVASLVEQIRVAQSDMLELEDLTLAGFKRREVEVLRLLADGVDTAGVAEVLNYSERTIKSILATLMARLNLRNRSHAIAHAARAGVV